MVKNHKTADSIFKFNAPGPKPNGLQASKDGLWIIDQGNSHIYKVDWDNGEIIHDIPTETEHPSGITIGDGYAWVSSTFSLEIFQIDIQSGRTIEKFPSPGASVLSTREHMPDSKPTGDHGLEWGNGNIYIASPPSQYVHVIEIATWKEIHRMKAPGFRVHGIAWAKEEQNIWIADTAMGIVSRHRLSDGRCYDAFRVPDPVQVHGMTIQSIISENEEIQRLWYCDDRGPIGYLDVNLIPEF